MAVRTSINSVYQERLTILVVHGRDFKPGVDDYAAITFEAMRAGLARDYPDSLVAFDVIERDIAWYGDLTNDYLERQGLHYDAALDIGDRHNALAALQEINARKRFGIRDYDRVAGKTALKELVADIVAPLGRGLGFGMWLIRRTSKDFAAYLEGSETYADAARERVRDKIRSCLDRGDCLMLITHGTGSAIAWDALWELSHDPSYAAACEGKKVDQWVTMGSPLANANVQRRLFGSDRKDGDRYPTNVISWQNLSAEDDYTCHDKSVSDDYSYMLKHRLVSQINDFRIFNLAVRYGRSNPHSSVGYFIHPRLSKLIADWIAEKL